MRGWKTWVWKSTNMLGTDGKAPGRGRTEKREKTQRLPPPAGDASPGRRQWQGLAGKRRTGKDCSPPPPSGDGLPRPLSHAGGKKIGRPSCRISARPFPCPCGKNRRPRTFPFIPRPLPCRTLPALKKTSRRLPGSFPPAEDEKTSRAARTFPQGRHRRTGREMPLRHDSCRKNILQRKRGCSIIVKVENWHYKYKKTAGVATSLRRSLPFHLWPPGPSRAFLRLSESS